MSDIIIKPKNHKFSADGYEEIEGRFLENQKALAEPLGLEAHELPNAAQAMCLYAIETRTCPFCEAKLDMYEALEHVIEKHIPEALPELRRVQAKNAKIATQQMGLVRR